MMMGIFFTENYLERQLTIELVYFMSHNSLVNFIVRELRN